MHCAKYYQTKVGSIKPISNSYTKQELKQSWDQMEPVLLQQINFS